MEERRARIRQVADDVLVSIIIAALLAATALALNVMGYKAQSPLTDALVLGGLVIGVFVLIKLLELLVWFLVLKSLDTILATNSRVKNAKRHRLRAQIIEKVLLSARGDHPSPTLSAIEFSSQKECEPLIRASYAGAKSTKILTIRGQKYFAGANDRNLLGAEANNKRFDGHRTLVLVLDPDAKDALAMRISQLNHKSVDEVSERMKLTLTYLKDIARHNSQVIVRCYNEVPEFKLLIFDDVLYFSCYLGPKNDDNASMLRLTKDGNMLFEGLEQYFDDLWHRSMPAT